MKSRPPAWLLAAALALAAGWASGDGGAAQSGGGLTAYDRQGNAITAANRFDGSRHFVQITSCSRLRGVNWDRIHSDGYQEAANAVAADAAGNVFVAGMRFNETAKAFWVVKLSPGGDFLWERTDSVQSCAAFNVLASEGGDAWVAGSCVVGGSTPARLARYDGSGSLLWSQLYDEGGRHYVRGLSLDFMGRASVTMEISRGLGAGGSAIRTAVYDQWGSRLAVY